MRFFKLFSRSILLSWVILLCATACSRQNLSEDIIGAWKTTIQVDEDNIDTYVFEFNKNNLGLICCTLHFYHNKQRLPDLIASEVHYERPDLTVVFNDTKEKFIGEISQTHPAISGNFNYFDGSSHSIVFSRIDNAILQKPFVPVKFEIPEGFETEKYRVRMLTLQDTNEDYAALQSTLEHFRTSIPGEWPMASKSPIDNGTALKKHEEDFKNRIAFTYAVVKLDDSEFLGCIYIQPNKFGESDAIVYMWVNQRAYEAGMDANLYSSVRDWIATSWPFETVEYPGRSG